MAPNVAVNSGTPAKGGSLPPGGEVVVLVVVLPLGKDALTAETLTDDTVGTGTVASEAVSAGLVAMGATTDGVMAAEGMTDGNG